MRTIFAALLTLASSLAYGQAPPPVPALPDTARLTSYSISGSTCACSVGFALYGDGTDVDNWIEVTINGTQVFSTDPSFGWSLSSVTGPLSTIPRPITDAILTFNSAQTATVQIIGARRPRRLSQFPENRGITARDFNQVITDIVAQNREEWDSVHGLLPNVNFSIGGPVEPGPFALTNLLQVHTTNLGVSDGVGFFRWQANGNGSDVYINKSRGAAVGTHAAVMNGDALGTINFAGDDGADFYRGAFFAAEVDGAVGSHHVPGRMMVFTSSATQQDNEVARWDSNGNYSQASTGTPVVNGLFSFPNQFEVHVQAGSPTEGIANFRWTLDGSGVNFYLLKSRGATIGTHVALISGDTIGSIGFGGSDGSQFIRAAHIVTQVDGAVSAGIIPMRLMLFTGTNTGNDIEGLRLDSSGHLFLYALATTPGGKQHLCIDTSTHQVYVSSGGVC